MRKKNFILDLRLPVSKYLKPVSETFEKLNKTLRKTPWKNSQIKQTVRDIIKKFWRETPSSDVSKLNRRWEQSKINPINNKLNEIREQSLTEKIHKSKKTSKWENKKDVSRGGGKVTEKASIRRYEQSTCITTDLNLLFDTYITDMLVKMHLRNKSKYGTSKSICSQPRNNLPHAFALTHYCVT